ncbi:WW-domain ligand protein [Colletotrichum orchidophilum]|uniref:WW-domain ligand protein n=1 Tax=Colletotrichum orchidophilum TaxID=1209926 RepID=A0A1G4AMH8_9PEZI|nr:WW-domain ligand protein [Colletotrichum orchidophilum]OHE90388.1 WW-domain ligand protein [Colletotrichum orchidophilum]
METSTMNVSPPLALPLQSCFWLGLRLALGWLTVGRGWTKPDDRMLDGPDVMASPGPLKIIFMVLVLTGNGNTLDGFHKLSLLPGSQLELPSLIIPSLSSASFPTPPVRLSQSLTHSLRSPLAASTCIRQQPQPQHQHQHQHQQFSTPADADADADAAFAAAQNATPFSPSHKVPPLCLCLYQDPPHHKHPDLGSFSASPAATDHAHSHATLNLLRRTRKLCAAAARRFVQNVNKVRSSMFPFLLCSPSVSPSSSRHPTPPEPQHHGAIPVSVRGTPPPTSTSSLLVSATTPHSPSTMTDQYLQEQHALTIARTVQRERQLAQARLDSDHGDSWVMITQTGDINPLPHEHIRHRSNAKVSLELSVPKALQQGRTPFARKSDNGTAYITTQRVIYIPAKPTPEFKSFHAPILNCADSYVGSPFFGAWFWSATVVPVSGGGVPADIPRVEVKLSFKEGGHSEFRQRFEELKERLEHVRRLQQETGQAVNIPDEPLPAYEATEGGGVAPSTIAPQQQEEPAGRPASSGGQNANRRPDEPPPNYDEAQAQTLSMRLEDHVREESDRA